MTNDLQKKLEAILFYTSEPVKISFLAKTLETDKKNIEEAVALLKESLENRGIKLLQNEDEVSLVTAPEFGSLIEKLIKEERERDLGKAGIETLSIIAYKGPVSKKEIEYIRGVNSQYALRSLLLRGLVERKTSQNDERVIVYNITSETLKFLGLTNINELPEYNEYRKELEQVKPEEEDQPENG